MRALYPLTERRFLALGIEPHWYYDITRRQIESMSLPPQESPGGLTSGSTEADSLLNPRQENEFITASRLDCVRFNIPGQWEIVRGFPEDLWDHQDEEFFNFTVQWTGFGAIWLKQAAGEGHGGGASLIESDNVTQDVDEAVCVFRMEHNDYRSYSRLRPSTFSCSTQN